MTPTAHPAAELFPLLDEARLRQLAADIKREGLKNPIVMCDGQILDGRNRWRACEIAGVTPRTVEWEGGNPWRFVLSHNAQRRDLDPGQRAAIVLKGERAADEYEETQRKRRDEANEKRAAATRQQHGGGNPRWSKPATIARPSGPLSPDKSPETTPPKPAAKDMGPAVANLAATAGVSAPTAARVQALANKRPDLLDQVASGALGLAEATRQAKRAEVIEVEPLPSSTFRVLYADPPWQYNDSRAGLADYSQTAAEDHYPTMSVAALCSLPIRDLADPDAVLFCWATFPLLPDALAVVAAWGFKYKTAFVWDKVRSNFGHYHNASAELLLVCTRGSATPDIDKREDQVQVVEREARHSEKPEHFRAMIDRLYPQGRRLELFRRGEAPAGWEIWGNEAVAA